MVKLGIYEEFTFEHYDLDMVHGLMDIMLFIVFYAKGCHLTNNLNLAPDSSSSYKAKSNLSFFSSTWTFMKSKQTHGSAVHCLLLVLSDLPHILIHC